MLCGEGTVLKAMIAKPRLTSIHTEGGRVQMAPGTVIGLALIGAGILGFLVAPPD
jgi:hypothetical protein